MPDQLEKETANLKAIFIGTFLIILIATVTIFKSTPGEKATPKNDPESARSATIDEAKIEKITSEELAKKIQSAPDLVLIDLREESRFASEHIIDSINIPPSNFNSFLTIVAKNKNCVLIEETGDVTIISALSSALSEKGYTKLSYLDGGFADWKNKFNQTIAGGNQQSFTDQAKVKYINSDALKKMLDAKDKLIIIDVRQNSKFTAGHLAGAINLPLDELEKRRKEIPSGEKIILYDDIVLGAFKGAVRLFDLGFPNALALSDGLDSWKSKNYELAK